KSPAGRGIAGSILSIELWVVTEDAHLVECDPSRRGEIGLHARPLCDSVPYSDKSGYFRLHVLHRAGESVAQPFDHLENREIDISNFAPGQIRSSTLPQHEFKIAKIFWYPLIDKGLGVPPRLGLLIFIVKAGPDGMMRVVNFLHEIGNSKLQLMQPEAGRFIARREPQTRPQI